MAELTNQEPSDDGSHAAHQGIHTGMTSNPALASHFSRRSVLKMSATLGAGGLVALSGCTARAASPEIGRKLQMWSWSQAEVLESGFEAVKKQGSKELHNVDFGVQLFASSDDVLQHLTLNLAAHETLPDIAMVNYLVVPELAAAGVLADLGEIIDPVRGDLYDGAHTVISYGGKAIAVPYELKSKLFFYREDLFQQAGIDPTAIESVSDLIAAGHRYHSKFPKSFIMGVDPEFDNGTAGMVWSGFPNGRFANASGVYEVDTNPCFAQTIAFTKQLLDARIGLPVATFSADWPPAIKNGVIGAFLTAQWMKTYLPGYAGSGQAGRWKAMLWPKLDPLPDQRYGSDQGGAVWIVPNGAPNRDVAIEYLRSSLLDPAGALSYFRTTAQPPLLRSARDNSLDYLQGLRRPAGTSKDEWLQQPQNFFGADYFPVEFQSYDFARTFAFDPNASAENDLLTTAAGPAYTGQVSIGSALASAQRAMANQLGNPYLA